MIRKDVLLAILATLCLTVTLFSLAPVRSIQPYDPWADLDDNGFIDIKDVSGVARLYGTTGDSTKNVTVTNWPSQQNTNVINWPQQQDEPYSRTINTTELNGHPTNASWDEHGYGSTGSFLISIGGYSRMFISLVAKNASHTTVNDWTRLHVMDLNWYCSTDQYFMHGNDPDLDINFTILGIATGQGVSGYGTYTPQEIKTKGPYVEVYILKDASSQSSGWITYDLLVYLRNE
jgi:hypothetical protein